MDDRPPWSKVSIWAKWSKPTNDREFTRHAFDLYTSRSLAFDSRTMKREGASLLTKHWKSDDFATVVSTVSYTTVLDFVIVCFAHQAPVHRKKKPLQVKTLLAE
eukprot:373415-Pleurochrysis_carterae.AAC.1